MPAEITIDIKGGSLVLDKRQLRATMRSAGSEVAKVARQLIRSGGSGRTYSGSGGSSALYRGGYKKGRFQASGAGDPPASITGTLHKSIKVRPYKSGEGVAIRSAQFYSLFLEAGAQGGIASGRKGVKGQRNIYRKRGGQRVLVKVAGSRILAPRPFLSRALAAKQASLGPRIQAAVQEGIKFVREK